LMVAMNTMMQRMARSGFILQSLDSVTFSSSAIRPSAAPSAALMLTSKTNHVTTIIMNTPKQLNGWTTASMIALHSAFAKAETDDQCHVVILTGSDPYYSAGVNLAGSFKLMHPQKLFDTIVAQNQALFDLFLNFKKPLIVAVNGPAFGASATSATLSDAIIASERASFLTPFGRLAVTPEGCSSVHFEYLMGAGPAKRMLQDDWQPTATEAHAVGLVTAVVPHKQLLPTAQALAEQWIAQGRHLQPQPLTAMGYTDLNRLRAVNATESVNVAISFMSVKFLDAQVKFLQSKNKWQLALVFKTILLMRPLWIRMLRR
jgi:peroxisomal 3,2-trans-enoyl-CoA isomerase